MALPTAHLETSQPDTSLIQMGRPRNVRLQRLLDGASSTARLHAARLSSMRCWRRHLLRRPKFLPGFVQESAAAADHWLCMGHLHMHVRLVCMLMEVYGGEGVGLWLALRVMHVLLVLQLRVTQLSTMRRKHGPRLRNRFVLHLKLSLRHRGRQAVASE